MRYKQAGGSTMGMLMLAGLAVFLLLFAFKTVPHYFDDRFYVKAGLKQIARDSASLAGREPSTIRASLSKYMQVNNVRSAAADGNNWTITQDEGHTTVIIDYSVKANLFGNLDLLMRFRHRLDTATPELCCTYRD